MKMKQLFAICGIAAALLICGASTVSAQDNNGWRWRWRWRRRWRRRFRGNIDPPQMQQGMMDLFAIISSFTNDTDWSAVQPLVQKVLDAQRDIGFGHGQWLKNVHAAALC